MLPSRLLLCSTLLAVACGSPVKKETKPDANAPALDPAVIDVPSDVKKPIRDLSLDSAAMPKKPPLIPPDALHRQLSVGQGYALVTAMMINRDVRSLSGLYDRNATLTLPDTTLKGAIPIAQRWSILAQVKSLREFQRITQGMRVLDDSTLADSGIYQMILKRTPRDSTFERGHYKATWRARPGGPNSWVMLKDQVVPGRIKGMK